MKELRIQTTAQLILSAVALAGALYWLRPVLIPFVLALFITIGLRPLVDFQTQRLHLPRPLALAGTLLVACLVLALIGTILSFSMREAARNAPSYVERLGGALARIGAELSPEQRALFGQVDTEPLFGRAVNDVGALILGTTNAILGVISQGVLVVIFVTFLLIGSNGRRRPQDSALTEIETRVKRYLATKLMMALITGFMVGGVLRLLGVDLALLFGVLAFLLNFVPSIGSTLATLLPLPVVLASPDMSWTVAILAIAMPASIQVVLDNFVEPKVMGDTLELHPVTLLLALIFWGTLWGVIGMLLATPITAVLKILFGRLETTRPLADVMAGNLDALH